MILVATANTHICRLYQYDKHRNHLTLLKEMTHPESKLKSRDILSDRPGHYQGNQSARGSYSPHNEAKENEIDFFSREIAKELNRERNDNHYDKFILISLPHMNGLISKHLDEQVKKLMINDIQKDLFQLNEQQLLSYLKTHTKLNGHV